jgi:diguanylate cyclase (GGDEF)-like protein
VDSENEISDLKSAINEMEKSLRERQAIESALVSARMAVKRDHLTNVFNRVGIEEMLEREFARYLRSHEQFSVLMIDLDHFKNINDTYGHLIGDEVLKQLSERLAAMLRLEDALGRFGGEEFLVLAPRCGLKDAAVLAERLRENIAKQPGVRDITVTVSIGVSSTELAPRDTSALVHEADKALYRAKHNGRNRIEVASPELVAG